MTQRIGTYVVMDQLGEGSAAVVYRAVREPDGMTVALKVLRPHLAADAVFRRRFVHEARTASEITHPSLLPILDQGESDGEVYLAFKLATGGSLATRIQVQQKLSLRQTVDVVRGVSAGLDALHGAGVIHRDIKPSNVVFVDDGSAVLTDFGLAKAPRYTALTAHGRMVGTIAYLAPERIKGAEASPASDIYAMACLAYECLDGNPPFQATHLFQLAFAQLHEQPEALAPRLTDLPPSVDQVLRRGLAKEPAHRPATAGAFYLELARAAEGQL